MYTKLKVTLSPGLVNLIILELVFLILACYIGLSMWAGLSKPPSMELVLGLILFLSALLAKNKN